MTRSYIKHHLKDKIKEPKIDRNLSQPQVLTVRTDHEAVKSISNEKDAVKLKKKNMSNKDLKSIIDPRKISTLQKRIK